MGPLFSNSGPISTRLHVKFATAVRVHAKIAAIFLGLTALPTFSYAQSKPAPVGYTQAAKTLASLDVTLLPSVDVQRLLAEDAAVDAAPLRYAVPITVSVRPDTAGDWETLADGSRLWRYRVYAPSATDLNFAFSSVKLPEGGTLHVYSESERYFQGPYTSEHNRSDGQLWTSLVPGDRAVVELHVPPAAEFDLELTQVSTGYRDLLGRNGAPILSSHPSCSVDVACSQGDAWRPQIRSVARYSHSGTELCTGTLIMDEPGTFTPYFLTADHCGVTSANAASVVVYWNFESPNCGDLGGGSLANNQSGAQLRATRTDVDITLLELDQQPDTAFDVYYSGWDRTSASPTGAVGIHHPNGHEKSINIDLGTVARGPNCIASSPPGTHWYVTGWEEGTTASGSSGSGLWSSSNQLLIGTLSGGTSSCSSSGFDCYGQFGVAWDGPSADTRLRDWLDPAGNNPSTKTGQEPGAPQPGTLALTSATYTVAETGAAITISVTRSGGSDGAVSVDYTTANATATAGADYTATAGTLAFADGATTATFTVPILDDAVFEGDETFTVSLSNAAGGASLGAPTSATVTITDNESAQPGTLALTSATYTVAETGAAITISVTRSGGSDGAVSVDYTTANATATAGADYTATAGTLAFADGATTATFTVPILDDAVFEGDETFTVSLSNAAGGASLGAPTSATVTITDNESAQPGTLALTSATYTVAETGAAITISVTRSGGSDGAVSVDYTTANATATAGADYTATAGTLAFADGATTATFTVPILDDAVFEGDETFTVSLSNAAGGASLGAPTSATVTITDNESAQPGTLALTSATYTVAETGAAITISVTRSGGSDGAVSVDYTTANATATAGADYTATAGTLAFADGATTATFTVPILDDAVFEGDETFTVSLSNAAGGASLGAPTSATVTITDNESAQPGTLALTSATYTVAETGAAITISVTRSGGSDGAVSVDYTTANATATAGADYTATAGTLAFADGATTATFTVPILDDAVFEGDETFTVSLSNAAGGASLGAPTSATVTITDNESAQPGTLALTSATYTVAETGAAITISVTRSGGSDGAVSVDYTTANATATAGADYTATAGTLAFADGATTATFTVPILDDAVFEGDETFTVSLSNAAGGASLGAPTSATVTITDNESAQPGTLALTSATYTVAETGAAITISVTRSGGSDGAVSVDYTTANATATAGADYTATAGTLAFADGATTATFTVPILDDAVFEGDETFTVSLSNAAGGASLGAPTSATVTITDNESAQPGTLALTSATYTVAETGAAITISVTRSGGSDGAVSVDYTTANATATAGADYTATAGTLAFADGATTATFTVPILDDAVFEGDETFTVSLSNAAGGASLGAPTSATVTITDNESAQPGTLALTSATYTVAETGAAITISVTRSGGSDGAVSVDYTTANATATAGADYTATAGTLAFADGATTATFTVPILDDAVFEGDETFTVSLSNAAGGASLGAPTSATVTITDNESAQPGTLALTSATYTVAETGAAITISVTRSGGSDGAVSVDYTTANATATAGADYTATAGTLAFADGATTATFTVPILDDAVFEGDETFTVSLSNAAGGASLGAPTSATVTITDNESAQPGTLALTSATYTVAETGAAITISVTRSGGSDGAVSVDYTTANATATAGADYTATAGTLAFADGATTATFTVPILDDAVFEGDETFTVSLSNAAGGASLGAPTSATVTITDNESAQPGTLALTSATYTVAETGAAITISVTRSGGSDGAVSVDYTTANATATAGADYTATAGTLAFADGATTATFTVPILDDAVFEGDETFTVSLSNAAGGASLGAPTSATVTITDNESAQPGTLALTSATYTVAETGAAITISVTRSGGSDGAVSVDYTTANATATAGADYTATAGTLAFADGATTATFTVPILDDAVFEGDETFTVSLSNAAGGASLGAPTSATVTITDNESAQPGTLALTSATYTVAETGAAITISVTRSGGSDGAVSVDYTTANATATAGADYTATAGTLAFADGATTATFTVPILDDAVFEGDETFTVSLSNAAGGASLGAPTSATVTITDNESAQPGTLALTSATYTVAETGAAITISVTRSGGSDGAVSVDYTTANATATAGADYTATAGTLAFADGATTATFTVPILDDAVFEGDETFTVSLSNAAGGASLGAPTSATVTITDNESAQPGTLALTSATYTVAETGAAITISVTRSGGSDGAVSVDYTTANATATAGADYTATAGTLAFADGATTATFTVPILDDAVFEGDETFTVSLSNAAGGASLGAPTSATVTITDNESAQPGTLALTSATYTVAETGAAITISVTRSGGSDGAVSVDYTTANATATAGADYTATAGTLAFADGATTATFTVPILDDAVFEGDETFTVSLSNAAGGATLGPQIDANILIVDNDPAPPAGSIQFERADYDVSENDAAATIRVSRSGGTFGEVSVDYATSDGSATAGLDYTSSAGTISFTDGQTDAEFIVPIIDDTIFEGHETVQLTLGNAQGGAALGASRGAVLTILEDEVEPPSGVLDFEPILLVISEDAVSVALTVIRTSGTRGAITAEFRTVDGTAQSPADFVAAAGTVTLQDGETVSSIVIDITDDSIFEDLESFDVVLEDLPTGAVVGPQNRTTVRILDNDPPPPQGSIRLSGDRFSVDEFQSAVLITVTRSNGDFGQVGADYSTRDITATAGADYQPVSGTLNFADGVISAEILVPLIDDSVYEGTETFEITLDNVSGGATAGLPKAAIVSIVEDDPTPPAGNVQFSGTTASLVEADVDVPVTVVRTGGTFGRITVDYLTLDGTATVAAGDYLHAEGTLVFDDGVASQSFTVSVRDDDNLEGTETFDIQLARPLGGAGLGTNTNLEITVIDDEVPQQGVIQFSQSSVNTREAASVVSVEVSRLDGSNGTVSVDYTTVTGSATADADYRTASGTLIFADGVSSQAINVTIMNDSRSEPDETFTIVLSNVAGGAELGDPTSIAVTISDDGDTGSATAEARSSGGGGGSGFTLLLLSIWILGSRSRYLHNHHLATSRAMPKKV